MQNCTKNEKPRNRIYEPQENPQTMTIRDLGRRSTVPETDKILKKPQISSFQASASGPGIEEWPFKMTISLLNCLCFFSILFKNHFN